jgi:hypothetical protein
LKTASEKGFLIVDARSLGKHYFIIAKAKMKDRFCPLMEAVLHSFISAE